MRRGFTLVELSIVLVIIGLLIGGILVAQSMIATARVVSFAKQIQQIDAAVANFKTKYNSLPGDSKAMGCIATGNVCNNNLIESQYGMEDEFSGEIANFWVQLQSGGYNAQGTKYVGDCCGERINNTGPNQNVPQAMGSKNSSIVVYSVIPGYTNNNGLGNSYYWIADQSASLDNQADNGFTTAGSIKPSDAAALDTKIDDGNPSTGNVMSETPSVGPGENNVTPTLGTCWGATSNVYNTSSSAYECILRILILSQTGGSF